MSDPLFPPRTPFPFRDSFFGRIRAFLHSIVGRWVETHHVEQQNGIHRQIERQHLDLIELIATQDREIAQLKRMVAQLGGELGTIAGRLSELEGIEPIVLVETDESAEPVGEDAVVVSAEADDGGDAADDERTMLSAVERIDDEVVTEDVTADDDGVDGAVAVEESEEPVEDVSCGETDEAIEERDERVSLDNGPSLEDGDDA